MDTRCPAPECRHSFEVEDRLQWKRGVCPACGLAITLRPLAILIEIDRQHRKRLRRAGREDPVEESPIAVFPFSALLEDVRSLWNVGSMFRTADGAGFGCLYLCGITGCPPDPAIEKASLGAETTVAWEHHTSSLSVLPRLQETGVQIVALESTPDSEPLAAALARDAIRPPVCLVLGNETRGVSVEMLTHSSLVCDLPMRGSKESLNVAVAMGIAAYMLREAFPLADLSVSNRPRDPRA